MSNIKKYIISSILTAIVIVALLTITLDFSRFFGLYDFYNLYPSYLINRINVVLAAALVWLVGKGSLSKSDNSLMKLVFVVICVGEAFFLLAKPLEAVTVFAVCQSLLVLRHSDSLIFKLLKASSKLKVQLALLSIVLAALIAAIFIALYPFQGYGALSLLALLYLIILSMSLWTAVANHSLDIFPKPNSSMAALGMICFYFCDICVGLDMILEGGAVWLLANSLIWVFYTPAITLLALSCYKYNSQIALTQKNIEH